MVWGGRSIGFDPRQKRGPYLCCPAGARKARASLTDVHPNGRAKDAINHAMKALDSVARARFHPGSMTAAPLSNPPDDAPRRALPGFAFAVAKPAVRVK